MQISALARRALQVVFALSSMSTALTRPRLERRLRVGAAELNPALLELAQHGLLDMRRLRLTLPGLAVAIASGAQGVEKARTVPTKARNVRTESPPLTLFGRRDTPRAVA